MADDESISEDVLIEVLRDALSGRQAKKNLAISLGIPKQKVSDFLRKRRRIPDELLKTLGYEFVQRRTLKAPRRYRRVK